MRIREEQESVISIDSNPMPKATRIDREVPVTTPRKAFDFKLGYHLLRDARVGLHYKIGAFAIGFAVFGILGLIEFPVEEIVAVIPFLGLLSDLALDGLEAVYVPLLLACLMLPYLAPSAVVEQIRREREPGAAP